MLPDYKIKNGIKRHYFAGEEQKWTEPQKGDNFISFYAMNINVNTLIIDALIG